MKSPDTAARDALQAHAIASFEELIMLDPAQREARQRELHAQNGELGMRVDALLQADAREQGILEAGLVAFAPAALRRAAAEDRTEAHIAGEAVGPWRLLEALGSGGMGEVWLAKRDDGQFEQQVAIKLLKRGMDSDGVLRRFRRERQILARLEHPGIARLLDGGMTASGLPYFAMERIHGVAITSFADSHALDARARVRLAVMLCTAVDFAHRRLTIHRDLKPGNVLVTDDGTLKVLDFGIAKVLDESDDIGATETGSRVMSPAYASPEQLLGEPVAIATDVYAIGLILFELLSGVLPHGRSTSAPAKVSADITRDATEAPSALSHSRSRDPATRSGKPLDIDRELDLIVLQTLRREPEQRYASAAALADDLGRWLEHRPIRARATTLRYRFGKFVERNRLAVAAAVMAVIALLTGFAIALWQTHVARTEARRAEMETASSRRVTAFALSIVRELNPQGRATSVPKSPQELIASSVERARVELKDDDEARATLLDKLGELQALMGNPDTAESAVVEALEINRRIHGEAGLETANSRLSLGTIRLRQAKYAEAEELLVPALAIFASASGHQMHHVMTLSRLANIARLTGRLDLAIERLEESQRRSVDVYGADHPNTVEFEGNRAILLEAVGRLVDAEAAYRSTIARFERVGGKDFPRLMSPIAGLGSVLGKRGRYVEARAEYERALKIGRGKIGPDDAWVVESTLGYVYLLSATGAIDEASAQLAAIDPAKLVEVIATTRNLHRARANVLRARGQPIEARREVEHALQMTQDMGGDTSAMQAILQIEIALSAVETGEWELVESSMRKAETLSPEPRNLAPREQIAIARVRSALLLHQGSTEEAIALLQKSLADLHPSTGTQTVEVAYLEFLLARTAWEAGGTRLELAASTTATATARLTQLAVSPPWSAQLDELRTALVVPSAVQDSSKAPAIR